jgi:hypothetical protein
MYLSTHAFYSQIFIIPIVFLTIYELIQNTNNMYAAKLLIVYLLGDLCIICKDINQQFLMIIHHLIVLTAIGYPLYFEIINYYEYILTGCLFEISTIFLNNKILLIDCKQTYVQLNNILFVITFFIFRICIGSYMLYSHWNNIQLPKILFGLLMCLQYYWFCYILKKICLVMKN